MRTPKQIIGDDALTQLAFEGYAVVSATASDQTIAALARENVALKDRVEQLEKEARLRREWLDNAKRAAGYHYNVSFDDVWKDALAALLARRDENTVR